MSPLLYVVLQTPVHHIYIDQAQLPMSERRRQHKIPAWKLPANGGLEDRPHGTEVIRDGGSDLHATPADLA